MGLFGHMRIHESGIDHNSDITTTSNTSTMPSTTPAPSPYAPITTASSTADTDSTDLSCPHCPRTFTSHIGLVGHLQIHRTETGEPVPGAPTYTHHARLNCPHFPRTFRHRMGLFGHMRIHDDLRPALTPPSCAPTATSSITPAASSTPTTFNPTHTPSPVAQRPPPPPPPKLILTPPISHVHAVPHIHLAHRPDQSLATP
nr:unnamed protein product [Spirometra erinaceieuropaei]